MIRPFLGTWAAAALLLTSCGIETVSVLPAPDVTYTAQTDTQLSLTHSASRYAGTDFQGYEVYYRIYPASSGFSQLSADITSLGSSPLSTLTGSLGYQIFSQASASNTTGVNVAESLQISGLADGDTVTLDFDDFFANLASDEHPPVLTINGTVSKTVYRSPSQATGAASLMRFSTLRTSGESQTDMKTPDGKAIAVGQAYEIDVFITAYGMTSTVVALNSVPKPWGTIHDIVRTQ